MSDDLTTAYMMGVEDMRSRLHKQADEIERLRAENEKLREALRDVIDAVHCTRSSIGVAIIDIEPISAARKALKESGE